MIEEASAVAQAMHAGLLWWRLRWRRQKIRDLLDAFCKVQLRLFAQALAIDLGEELGIDVEERVVVPALGCTWSACVQGAIIRCEGSWTHASRRSSSP